MPYPRLSAGRVFLLIAVVLFAVASFVAFVVDTADLLDVVGLIGLGLCVWAASELVDA